MTGGSRPLTIALAILMIGQSFEETIIPEALGRPCPSTTESYAHDKVAANMTTTERSEYWMTPQELTALREVTPRDVFDAESLAASMKAAERDEFPTSGAVLLLLPWYHIINHICGSVCLASSLWEKIKVPVASPAQQHRRHCTMAPRRG